MTTTSERAELYRFNFNSGFFSTDKTAYPEGAMADGSENVFLVDIGRLYVFKGIQFYGQGGRTLFPISGGYASLNDYGSTNGIGSVFNYLNESLMAIGSGKIFINGTDSGATATSTLQIAKKVGSYTYPTWYTAGFPQPNAPGVRARNPVSPFTGLNTGTYSFKIAAVRSSTGGRSIASTTSAVIELRNQTVHISFPAPFLNGQDRWAIFGTKAGFGGVGVHYLVKEVDISNLTTIDGIPNSHVFEYNDSDLLPITAYINDYPPSAGKFAVRLENYVLVIGAYTNAIQVSLRNFPESFHPEHIGFLPKAPTAVLQDPQGRFAYVSTDSSVHMVSVVPSSDNPLIIQTLWSDIGVLNSNSWCTAGSVLFAFTEKAGPVTMGPDGNPDFTFAKPITNITRNWDASNVVVHYVPHLNSVAYSYLTKTYLFNLQTLKWSSPSNISNVASGSIISAVVVNRLPYICLKDSTTFTLYEYDKFVFGNSIDFKLLSGFVAPNYPNRVNVLGLSAAYSNESTTNMLFKLYKDFDYSTVVKSVSFPPAIEVSKQTRWFVPRVNSFAVGVEGTFSGESFNIASVSVLGTTEDSYVRA